MSNTNQINRAALTLVEGIKDTVISNVMTAVRTSLKVEATEVVKLLAIITQSVEEGYHRGAQVFERTVTSASQAPTAAGKVVPPAKPAKR